MCRTEPLLRSQGDDRISATTKSLYKPCVPPPRHLDGQGGVITFSENKQGSTGQTDTLETIWLERCVKREREKKIPKQCHKHGRRGLPALAGRGMRLSLLFLLTLLFLCRIINI